MLIDVLLVLEALLIASGLLSLRLPTSDRQFALSLVRAMLGLSLLIFLYLLDASDPTPESTWAVLVSEAFVAALWGFMALRLQRAMLSTESKSLWLCIAELIACVAVGFAAFFLQGIESSSLATDRWIIRHNSFAYYSAILILFSMLLLALRLEGFWRNLEVSRRWQYKFLVVGILLATCSFVWTASYRLTYMVVHKRHLLLLAILFSGALSMMVYATTRYKLLNKKIFVSRKIVQASVAPIGLAVYLLGLGTISLAAQTFGISVHYLFFWLLAALGLVGTGLYLCSGRLRKRVHHFISTHFYVNKYEYRDEWLSLSHLLRGAMTEKEIVSAAAQVLSDSLYVTSLAIWVGDEASGFSISYPKEATSPDNPFHVIKGRTALFDQMKAGKPFNLVDAFPDALPGEPDDAKRQLIDRLGIVLLSPILAGDQLMGFLGLGQELSGTPYGADDFDLITAVATQTASALLAARTSEELAKLKQLETVNVLSAFVLHDIKNAATMLSLVRENFGEHIHDADFQTDMLEAIDNAIRRMDKVKNHLSTLSGDLSPRLERIELCRFLEAFVTGVLNKLTDLSLTVRCSNPLFVETDQEFLRTILENLLMNSLQAGGPETKITLIAARDYDDSCKIEFQDDGPGIPAKLLPDRLFEPFQTTKTDGSGIGLWQAKKLLTALLGNIQAENSNPGARFVIKLPRS